MSIVKCVGFREIAFLIIGFSGIAFAQTCKVEWAEAPTCLNISQLSGDTITLPSNVTRLGANGLKLCPMSTANAELPAVVFVLDQSSSMNKAIGGVPAGDPLNFRATAIHNAMNYLYNVSPGGWFSYVEFGAGVEVPISASNTDCDGYDWLNEGVTNLITQPFIGMNASTVSLWADSIQSPIQNRCKSGTNYYQALTKTKEFANDFDPGDVNAKVSVIFISDGRPTTQTDSTWAPLEEDFREPGVFPPVYGIFLGADATSDGDDLATLSQRTGGTYNLVNPEDTSSLNAVMRSIIQTITRFSTPEKVVMTVNGVEQSPPTITRQGGGYDVQFTQDVPLIQGNNGVDVVVSYTDSATGLPRNRLISFTLNTTGPAVSEGEYPAGDFFHLNCKVQNGLTINGLSNPLLGGTTLDQVPWIPSATAKSLAIELTATAFSGDEALVRIVSSRTGDVLYAKLAGLSGVFSGSASLHYVSSTIQGLPEKGDSTNLIFEVAPFDTLKFRWVNPEDPRDSLIASLLLYERPVLAFAGDTLGIDQITSQLKDVAVNGARASVDYSWLTGDYVSVGTLARRDTSWNFKGSQDLKQLLLAELSDRLVVQYVDPIFKQEYLDTAWLVFDVPVLPTAWLLDANGDGRADQLQLTYLESRPANQYLPRYRLVWGDLNQDTIYFNVDSLNPKMSFDVVQIKSTAVGEQWTFALPTPFPFGHTSGSGNLGAGELTVWGSYNDRTLERLIPVADKVGPVLMEMWVDDKDVSKAYFRVSEPFAIGTEMNWILGKQGSDEEAILFSYSMPEMTKPGVYTWALIDRKDNRIMGGDSARLIYSELGGVRDLNGNGAHRNNPFVLVKGTREGLLNILIDFEEPLVRYKSNISIPQEWKDKVLEGEFRVLVQGSDSYQEWGTGAKLDKYITKNMPTLGVSVALPQLHGTDATGNPREGMLVDGKLAYITTVKVDVRFYDQLGQFVARLKSSVTIDDPAQVPKSGTVHLGFTWQTDPKFGLLSATGRAVGTGVLIATTDLVVKSEAALDLDIYDQDGKLSDDSLRKGDVKTKKKQSVNRLGYFHK